MNPILFGAAEIDITPNIGLPLAGYSIDGKEAIGVRGHLFARAFYLEDEAGERVAFCVADLHSGTRYLHEAAANRTGPSCGVSVDRLVLCGTHTHTGPGNLYGNNLYDTFTQKRAGLDEDLADWLASRIALAVEQAAARAEPALIGMTRRSLWGVTRNRSLPAFLNNPDSDAWNEPGAPGENCPPGLPETRTKVDPRISVLTGVRDSDRQVLGALAFYGCHTTTLGMAVDYYAPDWTGYACRRASWDLERTAPGPPVIVAVGLTGAGDVNGLRMDQTPPWRQGPSLAQSLGARIGVEIAKAARAAKNTATGGEVRVLYAEPTTADGASYPKPKARLAEKWMMGASALAGSDDGRSAIFHLGLAKEGMTGGTPVPHRPKAKAAGPLQDVLEFILDLEPGPVLPLHAVRAGDHLFVTVPGEPTAHSAFDIERAVLDQSGTASATVIGFAGDYFGYLPTPREYDLQHYEGGSTIFGRYSVPHVKARLVDLLEAGQTGPLQPRPIEFDVHRRHSRFKVPEQLSCTDVDPNPWIERRGNHVHVRWEMDWEDLVPFALEWFVRVEAKQGAAWSPLQFMGRDFDDVHTLVHIERDGTFAPGSGTTRWHARLGLPARSDEQGALRVSVNRRGDFPGFRMAIPPKT
jgi:neutral ceramidase